jgi:hypothetical protein
MNDDKRSDKKVTIELLKDARSAVLGLRLGTRLAGH